MNAQYFTPDVPTPNPKPLLEWGLGDSLKTVMGMATNPIKTLSRYQFELPVFQYSIFGTHFTVVNEPDMIRHCFVDNAENYTLEPIRQSILTPVLRGGLVAVEGERWKRARRVLAPIFTPRFITRFGSSMKTVVEEALPDIFIHGMQQGLAQTMSELAYGVLSETLFSGEITEDASAMMSDVSDFFQFLGNVDPLDMLGAPGWMPRPTRLRGRAAVRRLRNRIDALTRSRAKRQSNGDTLPDDLLTRLINSAGEFDDPLSFGEIEDHILTFIAAGHETTARGLSWLLYLLTHDPRSMAKVYSEVDAVDLDSPPSTWQSKLPFLTACFDEAMRLYPPAPFLTRMARKDDRFGLAFVPAGGYLFLNLYALHRHRLLWEQPDSFKPERFMDRASANIGKYQYLPFGVGHRTCIGGHFAVLEAIIILVLTLRRYRFEYAGEKPPWPVMRITLKPDNDMPMRVFHR